MSEGEIEALDEVLADPDVDIDPWASWTREIPRQVDYNGALTAYRSLAARDRVD